MFLRVADDGDGDDGGQAAGTSRAEVGQAVAALVDGRRRAA
jgi:hypothetical protein